MISVLSSHVFFIIPPKSYMALSAKAAWNVTLIVCLLVVAGNTYVLFVYPQSIYLHFQSPKSLIYSAV